MVTASFTVPGEPEHTGADRCFEQDAEVRTASPILFASDFSDPGSYPVRYVNALAKALGTSVFFEYLPQPEACFPSGNVSAAAHAPNTAVARVHDAIQHEDMLNLLTSIIRKHHPSLLVVGASDKTGSSRSLLGSLARTIAFRSGIPVLIVGTANESALEKAGQWQKVLAATDLNPPATTGLLHAHSIAGAQLIALHCVDRKDLSKARERLAHLQMLAPFNESHTVPVQHIVRAGEATEVILSLADETAPDLIVLGSPVPSRENAGADESVVCGVVKAVRCPVLLMPPQTGKKSRTH